MNSLFLPNSSFMDFKEIILLYGIQLNQFQ